MRIVYTCLHLMPLTALLPELTGRVAIDIDAYTESAFAEYRKVTNDHSSGRREPHAVVR